MDYLNKLSRNENEKTGCATYIVAGIIVIAFIFGLSCLEAWIGMLLWNWVMPTIWASAPTMSFWPMWGLVELCSILFRPRFSDFGRNKD